MSDIAKWALLVAGMVAMIALLLAIPLFDGINLSSLTSTINQFTGVISPYIGFARGLINYLVLPQAIPIVNVILVYILTKPLVIGAIHLTRGIYSWIFK